MTETGNAKKQKRDVGRLIGNLVIVLGIILTLTL